VLRRGHPPLHELSVEVLSSYQLAEIARISEGFGLAAAPAAVAL
jgi:hypothetical protein